MIPNACCYMISQKKYRKNFQSQFDQMDCGPACLKMIAAYYGKDFSLDSLRQKTYLSKEGVSLANINYAAEEIGFRTLMIKSDLGQLVENCPLPCVLFWNQNHFVVLYEVKTTYGLLKKFQKQRRYVVADPEHGIIAMDEASFTRSWIATGDHKGVALLLEPSPKFYENEGIQSKDKGFGFLFQYIQPYKRLIFQIILGMLGTSLISLILPFLMQTIVDVAVKNKDLHLVWLVLAAQAFLFLGETAIEILRKYILLHVNTRVSLSILSDFLLKLFKLPIRFFDSKSIGDLNQRINDHVRIENFLTGVSLETLFSLLNILVFSFVLYAYNVKIFFLFLVFSTLAVTWVLFFLKKRKQLDYKRFQRNRESSDKLYELIVGMHDIKLNNGESFKRWEWERLQIKLFRLNLKSLSLEQFQRIGFAFFTQFKNIVILFIAAESVIQGSLTLGALLSISYIIGQTNGPIEQFVTFLQSAQDAKISMNRLQEIQHLDAEETKGKALVLADTFIQDLKTTGDIVLENVSFQYEGPHSPYVLQNVSFKIPAGKITAIVGASGSGKSTLMKLLLGYYTPTSGSIQVGDHNLNDLSIKTWRSLCGVVLQEGYLFSDTITRNIAVEGGDIQEAAFWNAVEVSNLNEFVENLPLGFTTKIGNNGVGVSGGQKQRILIARAAYKQPDYLFFDEATSSLDTNNERIIMNRLSHFFHHRTVCIIAHRLSTVKNADQIIVLDKGKVVEIGHHEELVKVPGYYYSLVKNQLDLELTHG